MNKIEIRRQDEGGWTVISGDRFITCLCWEEMLGLIASLTMGHSERERAGKWMRTPEQTLERREFIRPSAQDLAVIEELRPARPAETAPHA